ncbi:biotin carboxylase N-terminal domain-containing protein [Marinactinospora rubrisoli]|uniref:biotin carboxylase n=1 Tax=Marinactinospora rubrisoli TaxID=2715399 RepID=A0ABW2KL01_9ACTN
MTPDQASSSVPATDATSPVPATEAALSVPATEAVTPTVLVANRGEIAVRVMRTLRRLGLRSVAIHTAADAGAPHTRAADVAVQVGDGGTAGYLDGPAVIAAAHATGATMIHPGYGFLSENADFARACAAAGLVFVGPPPEAIEAMGDKIRAKRTVADAGVPLLPGFAERDGAPMSDDELLRAAAEVGYPLLIKPSAGGGGKGMRLVREPSELPDAAAAARREARGAFGSDTLLVERFVERPRHIEVQVLADSHGAVLHLGERECSLQRRHQKIIEEAPSPLLTPAQRAAMGEAAVAAAKACGYVGAGTVEFIVAGAPTGPAATGDPAAGADGGQADVEVPGEPLASSQTHQGLTLPPQDPSLWTDAVDYAFLEMNTRLQVEHPVTEAVVTVGGRRGIDLVELQLRIALGEPLPFTQADIDLTGHAVEARVYAEDPARDFLPTGGSVLLLDEPRGPDVRVDSGLAEGAAVGSAYDPMLAKVVAWAPDRAAALRRLDTALGEYTLLGCTTNVAFLRRLLRHPEVTAGRLDTGLTERARPHLAPATDPPEEVYAAAALDCQLALEPPGPVLDRFDVPDGWRVGGPAWTPWRLRAPGGEPVTVRVRRDARRPHHYQVRVADGPVVAATAARTTGGRALEVSYGGRTYRYARAERDGGGAGIAPHDTAPEATLWLGSGGSAWRIAEQPALAPARATAAAGDGTVRSPMPGTVLAVPVEPGARVRAGAPVAVVEAMKMEHTVTAPLDGVITRLEVRPGQPVAMDTILAVIAPESPETPATPAGAATAEE